MKFNKILAAAAFSVLSVASVTSHAAVILIDDFAVPGVAVTIAEDTVGNVVSTGVYNPTAPSVATARDITLEVTANQLGGSNEASVQVGGGAGGFLQMSNDGGVNSIVTIEWTIGAIVPALGDPAAFAFDVLFSDLGQPVAPTDLAFSFNGVGGSFNLNDSVGGIDFPGGVETFQLAAGDAAIFSQGGTLKLIISGTPAWELALDSVELRIPEPGSLALAGLALVGLAAARRRKA